MEQPITTSTISEPVSVVNDNDQNNKLVPCCFCNTDIIDEVNLGALRQTYGFRAHYYCLLLSSTISQSGKDHRGIQGFTAGDIKKELRNCENRVCCYCRQNFANLKCMYTYKKKKCNRFFHLPCGLRHFTGHEFFGMFKSYCHSHRAVCQIPKDIRGCFGHVECVICLEIVNVDCDVRELYMPNCCKRKAIMHVSCLKHYALQAGYYMKCPMCNNTNDFIANIIKFGVFVPMRDALWEKRSAYGDLERGQQCDAENCTCPHRNKIRYKDKPKKNPWYILTCRNCGGSGIHRHCNNYNITYICNVCKLMNANSGKTTQVVSQQKRSNGKVVVFYDDVNFLCVSFENSLVQISGDKPAKEFYLDTLENSNFERKPPEWFQREQDQVNVVEVSNTSDMENTNETNLTVSKLPRMMSVNHTIQKFCSEMSKIEENLHLLKRQRVS